MILYIIYCRPLTFIGVILCCPFYSYQMSMFHFLPNNAIYRNFDCKIVERKNMNVYFIIIYNQTSIPNSTFFVSNNIGIVVICWLEKKYCVHLTACNLYLWLIVMRPKNWKKLEKRIKRRNIDTVYKNGKNHTITTTTKKKKDIFWIMRN